MLKNLLKRNLEPNYVRNFLFGAEDSLVSTLGVLFGITAVASFSKSQIFITGLVTIVVEATSMGAGSFLSETETNELNHEKSTIKNPVVDGVIMFFAYFFAGFIPLAPYIVMEIHQARYVSILASFIALFFLGYVPTKKPNSGLKMVTIAGVAALIGFLVAHFFNV